MVSKIGVNISLDKSFKLNSSEMSKEFKEYMRNAISRFTEDNKKLVSLSLSPKPVTMPSHSVASSQFITGHPIHESNREKVCEPLIFDDDENKPKIMSNDWIIIRKSDSSGTEPEDQFEAKRLMLNEYELDYVRHVFSESEAKLIEYQAENCWIVRSYKIDSDQRILTTKQIEASFRIVENKHNGPLLSSDDLALDNKRFWSAAVGFFSEDKDLGLDENPNINVFE